MGNNNIVKSNNHKVVLILTIVIILLLVVIIALGMIIAGKEYKYCHDNTKQDKVDEYIDEVIKNNQDEYDIDIEILSMNKPIINQGSLNHHLYITGDMNIYFKEDNFHVVGLEGYCLGEENEKYLVYGPKESEITFNNDDMEYYLVESIDDEDGDVIYPDGTRKNSSDIDWNNIKIESCKIEKLYTVYTKDGKTVTSYTEINYEKNFN